MTSKVIQIRQLTGELQPPATGKRSVLLSDDADAKIMLFAFAAGDGLAEHTAPLPAIIEIIEGDAALTVGEQSVTGARGTWIQMPAQTPHSIQAQSPVLMLLTLLK